MFQNKVEDHKEKDHKVELLRAVFKNMYLKEKCDYLDSECKMLAQHILSSQVTKAESGETKLSLQKELEASRQLHEQKMHELLLAKEKIVSLSLMLERTKSSVLNSVIENKSMNEELDVKNDMIKCLQEELIFARLEAAEKWAQIRELKEMKNELEKDKEMLTKTKPETIARLQEELITAKLLETQYSLEFGNIKSQLQRIKSELDVCRKDLKKENCKSEGKIKLSRRGVLWQNKDKSEEKEVIEEEIQKLEKEKSLLQNRIPELQSKLEILQKHIQFKETERNRLQAILDNTRMNYQNIEKITIERKRQYNHLENSGLEKVILIRNSSKEKVQNVDELSSKLDDISQRRYSCASTNSEREMNAICDLEEKIAILEDKIAQLKLETSNMKSSVGQEKDYRTEINFCNLQN